MSTEFLTVVGEFGATGCVGPLQVGLGWADLVAALRELDLTPSPGTGPDADFIDKFDGVDIEVTGGRLTMLGLDHNGDAAFKLPPALVADRSWLMVTRAEVVAQLARIGCAWSEDPALTFPGWQTALRTNADVSMVFARPSWLELELADDDERLVCGYITLSRGAPVVGR
jgi:hypothetical protein